MRRHAPKFFVEGPIEDKVTISGEDARHLRTVRRAAVGDELLVGDGEGKSCIAAIVSVNETVVGEVISREFQARPDTSFTMMIAHSKGDKSMATIASLVELGVDEIVVFSSERSIPRSAPARSKDRWETVAREAAKQSHRAWLPRVRGPLAFDQALREAHPPVLVGRPSATLSLQEALRTLGFRTIAVGPEGDFATSELEAFADAGGVPFSAGPQILRSGTAAVSFAAAALLTLGRLKPR